jgi:hypothetical protein
MERPGQPQKTISPTGTLSGACAVMTIKTMGAFRTHRRPYCGPERTPPGVLRRAQFGEGFMTQNTDGFGQLKEMLRD